MSRPANPANGPWGVFNNSFFQLFAVDQDESTVSGEVAMYDEKSKKPFEDSEFRKGERKDVIYDVAVPRSAHPVKLIVLRNNYALRYAISSGSTTRKTVP